MARAKIDTTTSSKYLNSQQIKELAMVAKDILFFATFIFVIHPKRSKVPFDLYPYQKSVVYQWLKFRFNIILKFRQAGITELISMFCLWLAMYHPNKKIQIISIKDQVAKKVLKKIKFMYKNLPPHLRTPIVNGRTGEFGTSSMMEFCNGSFIESLPASEDAGRGESLSLLVIDEAAIVRWASTIWAAAFPTLSTGGSAIINSTPYGVSNFYHSKWVEAVSGGDLNPIRLFWQMHPERDEDWYNEMSNMLGARRTAQEIDGDFLSSGNTVFDLTDIKAIEDMLSEYPAIRTRLNGQYREFGDPEFGKEYFIGADVSTGRATDYSSLSLMDKGGEEWGCYKGRLGTSKFAKLLGDTGIKWNEAVIAPETNDVGLAVTSYLQDEGYPNLYYSKKLLRKKGKNKAETELVPGWLTTSKNRSLIIDNLEKDIREENIIVKDPYFPIEAYTFIYDASNRPVAMGKHKRNSSIDVDLEGEVYSDDDIFGKAICNHIRKGETRDIIVMPQ